MKTAFWVSVGREKTSIIFLTTSNGYSGLSCGCSTRILSPDVQACLANCCFAAALASEILQIIINIHSFQPDTPVQGLVEGLAMLQSGNEQQ